MENNFLTFLAHTHSNIALFDNMSQKTFPKVLKSSALEPMPDFLLSGHLHFKILKNNVPGIVL